MTSFGTYNLSKTASFWISCKSLQTTLFWISDLKHIKNDVVLDCRFGIFVGFKKKKLMASKTTPFCTRNGQNNVVLAVEP